MMGECTGVRNVNLHVYGPQLLYSMHLIYTLQAVFVCLFVCLFVEYILLGGCEFEVIVA